MRSRNGVLGISTECYQTVIQPALDHGRDIEQLYKERKKDIVTFEASQLMVNESGSSLNECLSKARERAREFLINARHKIIQREKKLSSSELALAARHLRKRKNKSGVLNKQDRDELTMYLDNYNKDTDAFGDIMELFFLDPEKFSKKWFLYAYKRLKDNWDAKYCSNNAAAFEGVLEDEIKTRSLGPWWLFIRSIEIHKDSEIRDISMEDLEYLLTHDYVRSTVEILDLPDLGLGDELADLFEKIHLPNLKSLQIPFNNISGEGIRRILSSSSCQNGLEVFDIYSNNIPADALYDYFIKDGHSQKVKHLSLGVQKFNEEESEISYEDFILSFPTDSRVEYLDIFTGITEETIKKILKLESVFPSLRKLILSEDYRDKNEEFHSLRANSKSKIEIGFLNWD